MQTRNHLRALPRTTIVKRSKSRFAAMRSSTSRRVPSVGAGCRRSATLAAPQGRHLPRRTLPIQPGDGVSTLTTTRLAVSLSDRDGNLTFKTAPGETLLRERQTTAAHLSAIGRSRASTTSRTASAPTPPKRSTGSASTRAACSTIAAASSNSARTTPTSPSPCWSRARATPFSGTPPPSATSTIASRSSSTWSRWPRRRSTTTSSTARRWTHILHQYRSMTGHAPLFPEWAYGFFQSKDRYKTQD